MQLRVMAQSSLSLLVLLVTLQAWMLLPVTGSGYSTRLRCRDIGRQCTDSICGIRLCKSNKFCCHTSQYFYLRRACFLKTSVVRQCTPFRCENNGILRFQSYFESTLCREPTLYCACPSGFTGRCCQKSLLPPSPCSATSCPDDSICVVVYGRATCERKDVPTTPSLFDTTTSIPTNSLSTVTARIGQHTDDVTVGPTVSIDFHDGSGIASAYEELPTGDEGDTPPPDTTDDDDFVVITGK
ncbi:uncharacterized protein LOC134193852 [Corticium candelabrum]|uniref:uncharacterized protein LOC134193852 n=1 Tax=Corticium candelabrum TaxID=121492 RepID=UPI002E2647EB|nr:uncharacterized protein LOC134193852 [Corticium candelabrum]